MSNVRKDEQKEGDLALEVLSQKHAKYVIQITANPKIFLPQYSRACTDDLVRQAKDINRYIWAANNIKVNSPEDYRLRRQYQEKAALTCNTLLADIGIAKVLFHLKGKRVRYWTAQVVEIRNKTRAWKRSDADRYRKYR